MKRWMAGAVTAMNLACGQQVVCVARGTRVATSKGQRRIEELAAGDEVIAVDAATGSFVSTRLSAVRSASRECGALTAGATTLTVTTDHPLYDPDAGGFFPAGDWLLGRRTRLLAFDGARCEPVKIEARRAFTGVYEVFDLTVESELHTFVAEGLVVHNKQPPECTIPGGGGSVRAGQPDSDRPTCTCTGGGAGRWTCETPGGDAVCSVCGQPDGG